MRKTQRKSVPVGGFICDKTDFILININFNFDFLSLDKLDLKNYNGAYAHIKWVVVQVI